MAHQAAAMWVASCIVVECCSHFTPNKDAISWLASTWWVNRTLSSKYLKKTIPYRKTLSTNMIGRSSIGRPCLCSGFSLLKKITSLQVSLMSSVSAPLGHHVPACRQMWGCCYPSHWPCACGCTYRAGRPQWQRVSCSWWARWWAPPWWPTGGCEAGTRMLTAALTTPAGFDTWQVPHICKAR